MTDEKKAVAIFGGRAVAAKDTAALVRGLKDSASDDPRGQGDRVYMSFSGKTGIYSVGPQKEDVDPEELWVVNIHAFGQGWICWRGGTPIQKRMASIYDQRVAVPDPSEGGPFKEGDGWAAAKSMILRSLWDSKQAEFSINSKSGVSVFASLQDEVAERMEAGLPCWPVIQLSKETFVAQEKKNFKPTITIYGWLTEEQLSKIDVEDLPDQDQIDALMVEADPEWEGGAEEPEPDPKPRRTGATRAARARL